jgi:hypothetical protein
MPLAPITDSLAPWKRGLRTLVQVILAAVFAFAPSYLTDLELSTQVEVLITAILAGVFSYLQNLANTLPD